MSETTEPVPCYPITLAPDRMGRDMACWVATHPDLPGCAGYGLTRTEALTSLDASRDAYVADLRARGESLPAVTR